MLLKIMPTGMNSGAPVRHAYGVRIMPGQMRVCIALCPAAPSPSGGRGARAGGHSSGNDPGQIRGDRLLSRKISI